MIAENFSNPIAKLREIYRIWAPQAQDYVTLGAVDYSLRKTQNSQKEEWEIRAFVGKAVAITESLKFHSEQTRKSVVQIGFLV